MADSHDAPKGEGHHPAAPDLPIRRPEHDTELERALDLDDDHLPRDTAPLERADLDALSALVAVEGVDAPAAETDEVDLSELELDDEGSDDTLNDTVASEAIPEHDDD